MGKWSLIPLRNLEDSITINLILFPKKGRQGGARALLLKM